MQGSNSVFYSLLLCLALVFCQTSFAQQIAIGQGSVSGRVKDSADMTNLPMATIAVYAVKDTALIKYQLNDLYGKFRMDGLPMDVDLMLMVTYVGYSPFYKKIKLISTEKEIVISSILLSRSTTMVKEVKVRIPPMVMRGDTLEFNADAFKTNKNAVIGDLIRTLPGFIVWGDGKITVNGKPVSKVLVEGKEFFANDVRISLNNIPKTAVDKIQVTPDKDLESQSLGDTSVKTVSVNIALKKNHKSGFFGKIGFGYGTGGRHEADIMLATYSPKNQLSVVGNLNNTNRNNLSVSDMMVASSYKTGLSKNLFQSDFGRTGIVDQKSMGVIDNTDWNKRLKTKVQYTLNQTNNKIIGNNISSTLLIDSTITRRVYNYRLNSQTANIFNGSLQYRDSIFNNIIVNMNNSVATSNIQTLDSVSSRSTNHFLNKSFNSSHGKTNNNKSILGVSFKHVGDIGKMMRPSKEDFDMQYELNESNSNSDIFKTSYFIPQTRGNTAIDRQYQNKQIDYTHYINAEYKSLANFLNLNWPGAEIDFQSELKYNKSTANTDVNDYNTVSSNYDLNNNYLTNTNGFNELIFKPALKLQKFFLNAIAGRYIKKISLSILAREQYISQNNSSNKVFRNINYSDSKFIPAASISYTKRIIGENAHQIGINYSTESNIPTITQLAPFIDSTQQYQFYLGNKNLRAFYNHNLELFYSWKQETRNGIDFRISVKTGETKNYISDSSFYNNNGIRVSYPVNVNGYKYTGGDLKFTKPFIINKNLFTYAFSAEVFQSYTPLYINGALNRSVSGEVIGNSELGYTGSNLLACYLTLGLDINHSRLADNSESFKNTNWVTGMQITLEWPRRFHIFTSSNFNFNKYDHLASTDLVIWNALISYRLSKKEQFEIKLSANDILNQSAAIRNFVNNNTLVFSRTNNLQQYFLLGLSYYPRFFGKEK